MSATFERIKSFLLSEGIDTFSPLKAENLLVIDEKRMPENVKSAVIFLMPYFTGNHGDRNVSLYAVGLDYHLYVKELSAKFERDEQFCSFFADTSPINERDAALKAGLGLKGQNGLVINEKYGSYVFIGTILTDAEFDEDEYTTVSEEKKTCMGCGLCKKNCAFLGGECEFCLSELNQRKNVTDEELEIILSKKIRWGCDTCQEVCPHNKNVKITPIEFFHRDLLGKVDADMIESMSKDEFSKRAYAWRGKKTLLRNLGVDKEK